ncbi:RNA polymerase sigma factor [Balneatrix alpica]|uniref:RNA polymerase sigma factor n=1 Tax=Balneatrix alpica TaxID=75684 RepID=A0ABV5ZF32_9GAMM|nr:RNA polymerase sigma factor [Balneatrix alpica]
MSVDPYLQSAVEQLYRQESRRVLATLIRLLGGNFELAEEAMHEAFSAALQQWPTAMPDNPRAWLISTGRFKAIDQLRRRARFDHSLDEVLDTLVSAEEEHNEIEDDRLRLIFVCCHPSLATEAQVALTLRELCDLTTEQIAQAFLCPPSTLAQRIVRAKAKIRDARIPFEVPAPQEWPTRLAAVLQVIYLVFNEGYSASSGSSLLQTDLSSEALRLAHLLLELLPAEHATEAQGLLALMLLHDARRLARTSAEGELLTLEQQDRSLWNQAQIASGVELTLTALRSGRFGPYTLQAAIAAVHAEAVTYAETDWAQIVGLYDALWQLQPSPVVALNRAVALSMRDGPAAGLAAVEGLLAAGQLSHYHLLHAARADLYRRLGQLDAARQAYQQALTLTQQAPEQRFLQRRLAELEKFF